MYGITVRVRVTVSRSMEYCFQVINAYSNTSQLDTLCVDGNKFDIQIENQTCSDCDNLFYGSIGPAQDLNFLWVLVCGCLVFFMQTGFTMFSIIKLVYIYIYISIYINECKDK